MQRNHKRNSFCLGSKPIGLMGVGLAALALLSGCASGTKCVANDSYQDAKAFPPLKNPAGLQVPSSESALEIPDVSGGPIGQYDATPEGMDSDNHKAKCLTTPPPMSS